MKKLGNKIAAVATPIARGLGLPCIDPETKQLRPESSCSERVFLLNEGRYVDAFYTFFRSNKGNTKENMDNNNKPLMQYAVIIGVEAEDAMDAVAKSMGTDDPAEAMAKIKGRIIAVNPAPQARAMPAPTQQPAQQPPEAKK